MKIRTVEIENDLSQIRSGDDLRVIAYTDDGQAEMLALPCYSPERHQIMAAVFSMEGHLRRSLERGEVEPTA